jgi:CDP-diacylglycerol---serine O-phosphatidyltransferase
MTRKPHPAGKPQHKVAKTPGGEVPNGGFPVIAGAGFEITFPDLLTSLNLVAGVAAVFSAISGDILFAIILVFGGMLFDYFDGKIARAYGLSHDFGRELDSLADLVTFGVAPGVIMLKLYAGSSAILVPAAIYAVAAAFRLARYNLLKAKGGETTGYHGLPVPAAAFVLALCALGARYLSVRGWTSALIMLFLAVLMVSTLRVPKLG